VGDFDSAREADLKLYPGVPRHTHPSAKRRARPRARPGRGGARAGRSCSSSGRSADGSTRPWPRSSSPRATGKTTASRCIRAIRLRIRSRLGRC
jgi:hypothetical protein